MCAEKKKKTPEHTAYLIEPGKLGKKGIWDGLGNQAGARTATWANAFWLLSNRDAVPSRFFSLPCLDLLRIRTRICTKFSVSAL